MASRFAELDLSVSDFIKENENENKMKTKGGKPSTTSLSFKNSWQLKGWDKTNWGNTIARIEYLFERVYHLRPKPWMQSRPASNVSVQWSSHSRWTNKCFNKYFESITNFEFWNWMFAFQKVRGIKRAQRLRFRLTLSSWLFVLLFETSWAKVNSVSFWVTMYYSPIFLEP